MNNIQRENLILYILAFIVAIILPFIPNNDIPKHEVYYESHVVKEGETLSQIVEQYGGNLKKSQALNPNPNVIMPGEVVNVVIEGR